MATHETCGETVLLGRYVGGDEGKDFQWDTVYGNERVPPFANRCQRGRCILIKLSHLIEGEAARKSAYHSKNLANDVRRRICSALQLLIQSEDELRDGEVLSGVGLCVH
jgi:hypothetical protein